MPFTKVDLRKHRCESGAYGIMKNIEDISAEDIITESYFQTDSKIAEEMARMYERMLVLAKVKPKEYFKKRDSLHIQIADFIRKNKLYSEWADFIYFVTKNIDDDSSNYSKLINAYKSEMMETWNYLTHYSLDKIYGVTSKNELLTSKEYYGDWDYDLAKEKWTLRKKGLSDGKIASIILPKFDGRLFQTERNENMIHIAIFEMIPFLNERTKNIHPKNWFPQAIKSKSTEYPRQWKETKFYKEQIKNNRKYMLDKKGVKILFENAGMFKEVLLIEDVKKDKGIILLFQLSTNEGSTIGYFSLNDGIFFTPFKYSDEGGIEIHDKIENFILELYTEIVVGLEKDRKRFYALKEVEDITYINPYRETQLYIQYQLFDEKNDGISGKSGYTVKPHERKFAIRKLRAGQQASDEALERAKEYGIDLPNGYTFVKSYKVGGIKEVRKEI